MRVRCPGSHCVRAVCRAWASWAVDRPRAGLVPPHDATLGAVWTLCCLPRRHQAPVQLLVGRLLTSLGPEAAEGLSQPHEDCQRPSPYPSTFISGFPPEEQVLPPPLFVLSHQEVSMGTSISLRFGASSVKTSGWQAAVVCTDMAP